MRSTCTSTGVYGVNGVRTPLDGATDRTKAQDFPGPSISFMDYLVAGARFELATFGL